MTSKSEEPKHQQYVVGFMFSQDRRFVALIRKARPEWQKGKLNGIGGKLEEGETGWTAMAREFQEETGCKTKGSDWHYYAVMSGTNDDGNSFECHCFTMLGDVGRIRTVDEDEPVLAIYARSILTMSDLIDNLAWLILLAIDYLNDGRPRFTEIRY
jgi:8-oxo-dGTP diphosphatase